MRWDGRVVLRKLLWSVGDAPWLLFSIAVLASVLSY